MDTYSLLRQAIMRKQAVTAVYDGYRRELSPHAIGDKHGVPHVLAYQSGGESSQGPIVAGAYHNWRCFEVSRLEILAVGDGWTSVPNYSRRTTCIDHLDIEVLG